MAFPGHARSFALSQVQNARNGTIADVSNSQVPYEDNVNDFSASCVPGEQSRELNHNTEPLPDIHYNDTQIIDDSGTQPSRLLWIDNIPHGLTLSCLRRIFAKYGGVDYASISTKQRHAYVNFNTIESAILAWRRVSDSDIFQCNSINHIRFAQPQTETQPLKGPENDRNSLSDEPIEIAKRDRFSFDHERTGKIVEWPNGPPPAGPKSQRKDISPAPPLRHGDSYRPRRASRKNDRSSDTGRRRSVRDDDKRGHDVYRPSYRGDSIAIDIDSERRKGSTSETALWTSSLPSDGIMFEEPEVLFGRVHGCTTNGDNLPNANLDSEQRRSYNHSPRELIGNHHVSVVDDAAVSNGRPYVHEVDQRGIKTPSPECSSLTKAKMIPATLMNLPPELDPLEVDITPQTPWNQSPVLDRSQLGVEGVTQPLVSIVRHRSPLQRLKSQVDDTSSVVSDRTSSSISSSRRKKCADCKKPESSLAALFACSTCPRRFHSTCGDPRPSLQDTSAYICGRCIKKWKKNDNKPIPTSSSTMNENDCPFSQNHDKKDDEKLCSPSDAVIRGLHPQAAALDTSSEHSASTVHLLAVVSTNSSANFCPTNQGTEKPFESTASATELHPSNLSALMAKETSIPVSSAEQSLQSNCQSEAERTRRKYKSVTCPWWQKDNVGGCSVTELECMFAHRETGMVSPNGFAKAKNWTCKHWYSTGKCPKGEQACKYAHRDTGFYVGIDGKASKKHMTCYYWRVQGQCSKPESKCIYAHVDTGIYVTDPCKAAQTYVRHSASSSISSTFVAPRLPSDVGIEGSSVPRPLTAITAGYNIHLLSGHTYQTGLPKHNSNDISSASHDSRPHEETLSDSSTNKKHSTDNKVLASDINEAQSPSLVQVKQVQELLGAILGSQEDSTKHFTQHLHPGKNPKDKYLNRRREVCLDQNASALSSDEGGNEQGFNESDHPTQLNHGAEVVTQRYVAIQDPRMRIDQPSTILEQHSRPNMNDEDDDYEPPESIECNITNVETITDVYRPFQDESSQSQTRDTSRSSQLAPSSETSLDHENVSPEQGQEIIPVSISSTVPTGRSKCKVCKKSIFGRQLCVACSKAADPGEVSPLRVGSFNGVEITNARTATDISDNDMATFGELYSEVSPKTLFGDTVSLIKHVKRKKSEDAMFVSNKRPKPNPQASYKSTVSHRLDVKRTTSIEGVLPHQKEKHDRNQAKTVGQSANRSSADKEGISPSTESNKENRLPPQSATSSENVTSIEFDLTRSGHDHERSNSEEPLAQASLRRQTSQKMLTLPIQDETVDNASDDRKSSANNGVKRHVHPRRSSSVGSCSEKSSGSEWHTPKSQLGGQVRLTPVERTACFQCSRKHVRCDHKIPKMQAVPSPETVKPKPACKDCNRRHKKCLHNSSGNFDGQTCYLWLMDLSKRGRKTPINERGKDERAAIEQAAEIYRMKLEQGGDDEASSFRSYEMIDRDMTKLTDEEDEEEEYEEDDDECEEEQESEEEEEDEEEYEEDQDHAEDYTNIEDTMGKRNTDDEPSRKTLTRVENALLTVSRKSSTSYFDSETDELALPEPRKISGTVKSDRYQGQYPKSLKPSFQHALIGSRRPLEASQQTLFSKAEESEWTEADEIAATSQLKARGVVIESEDEDDEVEPIPQLEQYVQCPCLAQLPFDPLRSRCRISRDFYRLFPEEHPRFRSQSTFLVSKLTKGQGLKQPKLVSQRKLQFNRQMFADAHSELDRKLPDRLFETMVERKIKPKESDKYAPDIVETTTENIAFRSFLGLPDEIETCLIGQGRGATLAFREAPSKLEKDLGIFARKRRIGDGEKWPVQDR